MSHVAIRLPLAWKQVSYGAGCVFLRLAPVRRRDAKFGYWRTPKASGGSFPKLGTSMTGKRPPDDPLQTRGQISYQFQVQHVVYGGPEGVARARREGLPLRVDIRFASWLMGNPPQWTECVLQMMAESPRKRRRKPEKTIGRELIGTALVRGGYTVERLPGSWGHRPAHP
jgi:hypothetical protein